MEESFVDRLLIAVTKKSWLEAEYLVGMIDGDPLAGSLLHRWLDSEECLRANEKWWVGTQYACKARGKKCQNRSLPDEKLCDQHEQELAMSQWDLDFENSTPQPAWECGHMVYSSSFSGTYRRQSWCVDCKVRGVLARCGHYVSVGRANAHSAGWNRETQVAENITCFPCGKKPRFRYGTDRLGFVYRLFDSQDVHLYTGKTVDVTARLYKGHRKDKGWWCEVARVEVLVFDNEDEALEAEAWDIKDHRPKHNKTTPLTRKLTSPVEKARFSGEPLSEDFLMEHYSLSSLKAY